MLGIGVAAHFRIPFLFAYAASAFLLLLALVTFKKKYFSFFLLLSMVFVGYLIYECSLILPKHHIGYYHRPGDGVIIRAITVSGVRR
jgi:hypothetical protein